MESVKLFLYIVLLVMDIPCSAEDISGFISVSSRDLTSDTGSAERTCTIDQPTVNYCISVYDGKPVLRVLAEVIPTLFSPLMFSISYKHGVSPVVMDVNCANHSTCTSLFVIDWEHGEVNNNSTINVTVNSDGCSNSTVKITSELWTNRIFDITVGEVRDTSATIVCELACFTEEIGCIPVDTNLTFHTSNITGRSCSYSYHSQNITFSNLASGNTYNVCISAYNLTTTELQGSVQCEIFTTPHYHDEGISVAVIVVAATVPTVVVVLLIVGLISYCRHKKCLYFKNNQAQLRWVNLGDVAAGGGVNRSTAGLNYIDM